KPDVQAVFAGERARKAQALQAVDDLLNWKTWTVDRIELQLNNGPVRQAMRDGHEPAYSALEKVFGELGELADSPGMRGTLRQLPIPKRVTAHRRGKNTKSSSPCEKQENNKYSFSLNDLKESVSFTFTGDEYSTPPKQIVLVPPPGVARLSVDKDEPAYI